MNPEAKNPYDDVLLMKDVPIASVEDFRYPDVNPTRNLSILQEFIDKENNLSRTSSVSLHLIDSTADVYRGNKVQPRGEIDSTAEILRESIIRVHQRGEVLSLPSTRTYTPNWFKGEVLNFPPMKEYIPDWFKGKVKVEQKFLSSISSKSQESKNESFSISKKFSFFTSENNNIISGENLSSLTQPGVQISTLFQPKQKEDGDKFVWWLDCCCATDEEIKVLCKSLGIHPSTIEKIKYRQHEQKVKFFEHYFFLIFHTFDDNMAANEVNNLSKTSCYYVVLNEGIISFSFGFEARASKHRSSVAARIRQLRNNFPLSSDWICYALINEIVKVFSLKIEAVDSGARLIQRELFIDHKSDFQVMLGKFGVARNGVMEIIGLLKGKTDVLKKLIKRYADSRSNKSTSFKKFDFTQVNTRQLRGEVGFYLEEVFDKLVSINQDLSILEQTLSRSHTIYLGQLQVESLKSSDRVDDMLSRVSLIGSVFLILSTVTGLWGMNVAVPGRGGDSLGWFFGIVGILVFMIIAWVYLANHWVNKVSAKKSQISRSKKLLIWIKFRKFRFKKFFEERFSMFNQDDDGHLPF